MMYGAYVAVTKYKNHLIKTIPVNYRNSDSATGEKKSANHIVRLEFYSEFSAGWKLRLVFYFFFSIFLLASSSLKDLMEWYISAMKQRAQSHELIVFEMTQLF